VNLEALQAFMTDALRRNRALLEDSESELASWFADSVARGFIFGSNRSAP
jgi:hypothetical protein